MKCSIVIRCYNEEEHIGRLLAGIMQQSVKDVDIVIVDSGSTDATLAIASRYPVRIVAIQPEDFSFGRSLNLGCQHARYDQIVIASAHVYPLYNDWLENLLAPFFDDDRIALVYGRQVGNEVTKYSEHQVFAQWFPAQSVYHQDYPFCNNANSAIRRDLWAILPYNDRLTGLEDLDWAKRVMELGYYISYRADAEIVHVHNETPKRVLNRYRREAIALRSIFPNTRFHWWDFLRLLMANIGSDYFHAARDGALIRNILDIPVFRTMQFLGTYQGYRFRGPVPDRLKSRFYYPRGLNRSNSLIDTDRTEKSVDYSSLEE